MAPIAISCDADVIAVVELSCLVKELTARVRPGTGPVVICKRDALVVAILCFDCCPQTFELFFGLVNIFCLLINVVELNWLSVSCLYFQECIPLGLLVVALLSDLQSFPEVNEQGE